MNQQWAQAWIKRFDRQLDDLMSLYSPQFYFIDINFELEIVNDLDALRNFFSVFDNSNRDVKYDDFDVFDYAGDKHRGTFQWTWKARHENDFLGIPAAGIETETRGMTLMEWDENGKIIREESIWDLVRILKTLGVIKI